MNKKLIFRILGALASALIVVSVFVPFVNVTGYSSSLWQSHEITKTLYLPIMIIVFGVIGILLFSINKKTEFVYTTTGAIVFFIVVQTFEIIKANAFKSLGIGYYFLVIGAILTGVMTFLMNLKSNQSDQTKNAKSDLDEQPSLLSRIDNLYNTTSSESGMAPIQTLEPNIQPITPISAPTPIQPMTPNDTLAPIQSTPSMEPIPDFNSVQTQQNVNPVLQQFNQTGLNQTQPETQPQMPTIPEFSIPTQSTTQLQNPAISDLSVSAQPSMQPQNPTIPEFANSAPSITPEMSNPVGMPSNISSPSMIQPIQSDVNGSKNHETNPVIQQFTATDNGESKQSNGTLTSTTASNSNSVGMDIFGQ